MATNFASNCTGLNMAIPVTPQANKFNAADKKPPRKRFEYKNPTACKACGRFGHCIETQVCRITAQVQNVNDFLTAHPIQAAKNLEAFTSVNTKTKINKLIQQEPTRFVDIESLDEQENALDDVFDCTYENIIQN